jgi:hypothetical protein
LNCADTEPEKDVLEVDITTAIDGFPPGGAQEDEGDSQKKSCKTAVAIFIHLFIHLQNPVP